MRIAFGRKFILFQKSLSVILVRIMIIDQLGCVEFQKKSAEKLRCFFFIIPTGVPWGIQPCGIS